MTDSNIHANGNRPGRRWPSRLSGVLLVTTYVSLLSGCLLNRVTELQAQTCDFEAHFGYQAGEYTELQFRNPVLLERDVARLAGVEPTATWYEEDQPVQRYRVEKVIGSAEEGEFFDLELRYRMIDGAARLASLRAPAAVGLVVDSEAAANAALKICEAKIRTLSASSTQAIEPDQLERFPDRDLLVSMLGLPSSVGDGGLGLTYRYRVLPPDGLSQPGADQGASEFGFTIWYDRQGDRPERLLSDYREFQTEADFRTLEARVSYRP